MPAPKPASPKPTQQAAASPPPANKEKPKPGKKESRFPKPSDRPIKYPRYEAFICCRPTLDPTTNEEVEYEGPITMEQAKLILGWETEDDYVKRRLLENPTLKESSLRFGNDFLLRDRFGNKVICHNNTVNRPFDEAHARKIAQDILTHSYEMNGEDIIIGRTGLVLSGQHRLIGLILACEEWAKQQYWQDRWEEAPVVDSLVFFGVLETQKVLQTLDNVKPRSLSDTFHTSPMFADCSMLERKEMSRSLDNAVDLLWKRLNAAPKNSFVERQTHSASLEFFDRHKKLLACVKHIYKLDDGEGLTVSSLGLNRGQCCALMYLMGASNTDEGDAENYYNSGQTRTEKMLDWSMWDRAGEFWSELAKPKKPWCEQVRKALAGLNDKDSGRGATVSEQHAVIALAWAKYSQNEEGFDSADITPEFKMNEATGRRYMPDAPYLFGGPDQGTKAPDAKKGDEDDDTPPEPSDIEDAKAELALEEGNVEAAAAMKARAEQLNQVAKKVGKPVANVIVAPKDRPTGTPKTPTPKSGPVAKPVPVEDTFSLDNGLPFDPSLTGSPKVKVPAPVVAPPSTLPNAVTSVKLPTPKKPKGAQPLTADITPKGKDATKPLVPKSETPDQVVTRPDAKAGAKPTAKKPVAKKAAAKK